jgi:hypothetical protein
MIEVTFGYKVVKLKEAYPFGLKLAIMYNNSANQVLSMAASCYKLQPLLYHVKHLGFFAICLCPEPAYIKPTCVAHCPHATNAHQGKGEKNVT